MKKILFLFIALICLVALASCSECEHKMVAAGCERGAYCSLCGYEEGAATGHFWLEATCASPKACSTCGTTEGEALPHTWKSTDCLTTPFCVACGTYGELINHAWVEATCETAKSCTACGITEGEALGHNWVQVSCSQPLICTGCDQTKAEGVVHNWVQVSCKEPLKCTGCDLTKEEGVVHSWVFVNCTTPRYCSGCDLTEPSAPEHQWKDATCKTPAVCTVCKLARGKALGHSWSEADCENPKTCARCAETEGEAKGHNYKFTERLEPTCAGGRDVYTCMVCGYENVTVYPAVSEYHICEAEGLCTGCGAQFDTSKMVLESIIVGVESETVNCGVFASTECPNKIYKPILTTDVGMPVINIDGDLSKVTKSEPVTYSFTYDDGTQKVNCFVELKIQGASSSGYAKKNYSIKLVNTFGDNNKVELVDTWGREHKYCLKANYIDYSQARNVVSGQLYGDVIKTQGEDSILYDLPSGGAIDGFPVVIFNNGEFHGLYTMNIPKDKWMFDMKDSDEKKQAIVMADQWGNSVAMRELISYDQNNPNWTYSSYWELEFASNEDSLVDNSTLWVPESLNRLIKFVLENDGEDFKNGISQYCDVEKCIDSILFTFFICADDNISKNILWVTYDGTHWFSSMYDMDGTWGLQWNGNLSFKDGNTHPISNLATSTNTRYNLLWQKIYLNFYDEIVERYWELREGPLSLENVTMRFEEFFDKIPTVVRNAERAKWSSVPSQDTNNLEQILEFARIRAQKMDAILQPQK